MSISALVEQHILAGATTTNLFPKSDWEYDVVCGYTLSSYNDWLEAQVRMEVETATDGVDRILEQSSRYAAGEIDIKTFAHGINEGFNALRAMDLGAAGWSRKMLGCEERPLLNSEISRNVPDLFLLDLSKIAHMAVKGRDPDVIAKAIDTFGSTHGVESEAIAAARAFLCRETAPELSGPEV